LDDASLTHLPPCLLIFLLTIPHTPISPPFPYTTLFRSQDRTPARSTVFGDARLSAVASQCGPADCKIGISVKKCHGGQASVAKKDRKSTRLNSSHVKISYAVFCLKKKKKKKKINI